MNSNLTAIHEAVAIAREDRALCLLNLGRILRRLKATEEDLGTLAKLDGDLHELDLLHRRELSIISDGREPTESAVV